ncbi:MAG: hypothetical protein ACKVPJ_14470 [Chitinophagales bacterium]
MVKNFPVFFMFLIPSFFSACNASKVQTSAGNPTVIISEVPKENESGDITIMPSAVDISYGLNIKPLIDEHCGTTCHSPQSLSGGIDLSTYEGVKEEAVNGYLIEALQHVEGVEPMPKDGLQWDLANIQLMIDWVNNGAQE